VIQPDDPEPYTIERDLEFTKERERVANVRIKELEDAIRTVVAIEDGYDLLDGVDVLARVLRGVKRCNLKQ